MFLFFSTIPNFSHRRIINKIVCPSMAQLALPWTTRGIRSCRRQSLLKSFTEKALMVSLPLLFVFPPPFRFFLTASFFQLNCPSVGRAGRPPSVNIGIKGPSLPYLPATRLQMADAVSLPPLFIISPTIPFQFFLIASFFQIAHQLAALAALPQSIKGLKACYIMWIN